LGALTSMTQMAFAAIRSFQETMASRPNEARDRVATLFDRITFTPIETPDGPRYQPSYRLTRPRGRQGLPLWSGQTQVQSGSRMQHSRQGSAPG
jgi:hypothetical protein